MACLVADRYSRECPFLGSNRNGEVVDDMVPDMQDIFLGDDDSIQRVVVWKPSMIAMESVVGRELQQ